MGKRIVTTDVEIIDAVIKAMTNVADLGGDVNLEQVNEAARDVVHILTKPPEKPSDVTGFEEDDA